MPDLSKIRTELQPDDPLVQNADYRFDEFDRAFIDEQIRACQEHLATLLLNSAVATWLPLDGASAALAAGDCVCASAGPVAVPTITQALPAALAAAGTVLGIALRGAAPGSRALVALSGVLASTITGLAPVQSPNRYVRCSQNARCERVPKFLANDFPIGAVTNTGLLTLIPMPQVAA